MVCSHCFLFQCNSHLISIPGHEYQIFPQPEHPNIDMYSHFLYWLKFLQNYIYHRALGDDDYIFPAIGSNGVAHIGNPVPHNTIQKWLDDFIGACEINVGHGRLTTHCFHHGGAQYHFMYAPFGKQWSLAVIRWWGGWAEGEHVCVISYFTNDSEYSEYI